MTKSKDTANDQPRKRPKPWRKLWRHESPRFRALSADARAMAAYLPKSADDDGLLGPMKHSRERVAADLMRDEARRRKRWEKAAAELFAHGTLEERDGGVYLANFKEYQARRARDERDSPSAEVEAEVTETGAPQVEVEDALRNHFDIEDDRQTTDKTCNPSESLGRDPTPFKREINRQFKQPGGSELSASQSSAFAVLQGRADDSAADDAPCAFSDESLRLYELQSERFKSEPLSPESFARFFFEQYEAETANRYPGSFTESFVDRWHDEVCPRLDEWFEGDDDRAKDYIETQVSAFCQLVACGSEVIRSSAFGLFVRKFGSWERMRGNFEDEGTVSPWAMAN